MYDLRADYPEKAVLLSLSDPATDNEPGDSLVTGPTWKGETPKDIKKVFPLRGRNPGARQSLRRGVSANT
jgi:hypothetical protein